MDTTVLKRYSAAEVVLLAIFAMGLGLSLIMVRVRTHVDIGQPVELPATGLSAPLPAGEQWETAGGWRYESDNAYALLAVMRARGRPMIHVRWRYILSDEPREIEDVLAARAESAGGKLMPLGVADGPIPMRYGHIIAPTESRQHFLIGLAELDFGRHLELLISFRRDGWFAENVFRSLVAGVVYDAPEPLARGADYIRRFYEQPLEPWWVVNQSPALRLLITDAAQRPVGFLENHWVRQDNTDEADHRLRMRQLKATGVYAESDLDLSFGQRRFAWDTRTWPPRSGQPAVYQLRVDADRHVHVETNIGHSRAFWRGAALLPAPLLPAFSATLIESNTDEIVVDLLTGNGLVIPTRLARVEPEQSSTRLADAAVVIRADYLHRNSTFDELFYDAQGRYIGRFEQEPGQRQRWWTITDQEQLQDIFGGRYEPPSR